MSRRCDARQSVYAHPSIGVRLSVCTRSVGPLLYLATVATLGCVDSGGQGDQVSEGILGENSSAAASTGSSATSANNTSANGSTVASNSSTSTTSGPVNTTHASFSSDSSSETTSVSSTTGEQTSATETHNGATSGVSTNTSSTTQTSTSEGSVDSSDVGTNSLETDAGSSETPPSCPAAPVLTGGQEYCSNVRGTSGNGYGYELWAEGNGTGCMTVFGVGAAFKTEWNDVEDFLARVGLDFDETRTHQQIGNMWAEFAETQTGSEEGLTYVGVYGWTVDPLREFYILDDWGATKPAGVASDGTPRDEVGILEIDGETYDVWKKTRENKPSIKGDATFDQYFSIRRTSRQCGRISVSEHFAGWEDLGLPFGKLYEVKLLVES